MKILKEVFTLFLIITAALIVLEITPVASKYAEYNPWLSLNKMPYVIPTGNLIYPEGTKYAYRRLHEAGFTVFHVNLVLSKDDKLIVHRDLNLSDVLKDDSLLIDLSYEEIIQKYISYNYADKYRDIEGEAINSTGDIYAEVVPITLEELFERYPDKMYVLDIKETTDINRLKVAEILCQNIKTYQIENKVMVLNTDKEVGGILSFVIGANTLKETYRFIAYSLLRVDFFYRPKAGVLILPVNKELSEQELRLLFRLPSFLYRQITKYDGINNAFFSDYVKEYIIADSRRHNIAIQFETNCEKEMKKLMNMDIDGIITERPDLALQVIQGM